MEWMCYEDEEQGREESYALGRGGPRACKRELSAREKESKKRAATKNHPLTKPKRVP